jgi:hypothetical protein
MYSRYMLDWVAIVKELLVVFSARPEQWISLIGYSYSSGFSETAPAANAPASEPVF